MASAPTRSLLSSASLSTAPDTGPTPARPSRLTVLAGPTAVGKGSISACIREEHPEVWISVSVTTRPPRPGEIDGVHYKFVDDARFDEMVERDELLEWAVVHQTARYGTPRAPVLEALKQGRLTLLEIDLQGARQLRQSMPEALFVFLTPPSWRNSSVGWSAAARSHPRNGLDGWRLPWKNWPRSGSSTSPS